MENVKKSYKNSKFSKVADNFSINIYVNKTEKSITF